MMSSRRRGSGWCRGGRCDAQAWDCRAANALKICRSLITARTERPSRLHYRLLLSNQKETTMSRNTQASGRKLPSALSILVVCLALAACSKEASSPTSNAAAPEPTSDGSDSELKARQEELARREAAVADKEREIQLAQREAKVAEQEQHLANEKKDAEAA